MTCHYCNNEGKMTKDHIVPVRWGGLTVPENLVDACVYCNTIKSARPYQWFKETVSLFLGEYGEEYALLDRSSNTSGPLMRGIKKWQSQFDKWCHRNGIPTNYVHDRPREMS